MQKLQKSLHLLAKVVHGITKQWCCYIVICLSCEDEGLVLAILIIIAAEVV